MSLAWLSYPPGRVPRLITRPFLKMTALSAGQPVLGSVAAVPDIPAPVPPLLTSKTALLLLPGSAPRSRRWPSFQEKACTR